MTTLPSALPASPHTLTVTPSKTPNAPDGTAYIRISGPHSAEWVNADDLRAALDKIDPHRPLTADDISDEMIERARWFNEHLSPETVRKMLTAALTEPTSPEEKVEGVLRRYWSGDINGDDLADRIVEEMNR